MHVVYKKCWVRRKWERYIRKREWEQVEYSLLIVNLELSLKNKQNLKSLIWEKYIPQ